MIAALRAARGCRAALWRAPALAPGSLGSTAFIRVGPRAPAALPGRWRTIHVASLRPVPRHEALSAAGNSQPSPAPSDERGVRSGSLKSAGKQPASKSNSRGATQSGRPRGETGPSEEQRAPPAALLALENAAREGKATDAQLAEAIESLLDARRVHEARALFERARAGGGGLPRPSAESWGTLVEALSSHPATARRSLGYASEALRAFEKAPAPAVYAAAIQAFVRAGGESDKRRAHNLFRKALAKGAANERAARALLVPLLNVRADAEAAELLETCAARGLVPGSIIYEAALSAYAERFPPAWDEGRVLWERAAALPPAARLPRLWNGYLKLCLNALPRALAAHGPELDAAGLPRDEHGIVSLIRAKMKAEGLSFDRGTYSTLCRYFEEKGDTAAGERWLEEARGAGMAEGGLAAVFVPAFEAAAKAADAPRVRRLLAAMANEGVEPTPRQRALAVRALGLAGRGAEAAGHAAALRGADYLTPRELSILFAVACKLPGALLLIISILLAVLSFFLASSIRRASSLEQEGLAGGHYYGLEGGDEGREQVSSLVRELLAGGRGGHACLNANVLCSAIESLGRCGAPEAAVPLVDEAMPALGFAPNSKVLTSLFQGFAAAGRLAEGVSAERRGLTRAAGRQVRRLLEVPPGGKAPKPDKHLWGALAGRVAGWRARTVHDLRERWRRLGPWRRSFPQGRPGGDAPGAEAVRGIAAAASPLGPGSRGGSRGGVPGDLGVV
eukprot:tig00000248_g21805.t1